MKMRISRTRREFGSDGFSLIDKDAGEQPLDIKPVKNMAYITKRKVLEIGLQAANTMKVKSLKEFMCLIEILIINLSQ